MTLRAALCFAVLALGAPSTAGEPGARFYVLDAVAVPTDINGDASLIVGRFANGESFAWSLERGLESLGGGCSYSNFTQGGPTSVSADGNVIVGCDLNGGRPHAAHRLSGSSWWPLSLQSYSRACGLYNNAVYDLNAEGNLAVGSSIEDGGCRATAWDFEIWWTPRVLPSVGFSRANAVSRDGRTIVGFETPFWRRGVAWVDGEPMPLLRDDGGRLGEARAVNADGTVVTGSHYDPRDSVNGGFGWIWRRGIGAQRIGSSGFISPVNGATFPANTLPNSISDDGTVVVGTFARLIGGTVSTHYHAFVWTPSHGYERIGTLLHRYGAQVPDWDFREATAVSADGRVIVGWGAPEGGGLSGWVIVLDRPAAEETSGAR
ncbi:hypothetical protein ABI59_16755 [Acidobacteria bacterium Mor1]|nr:hypothetical protein ABI59_16755 [Acidobacteria bacterium Mor1]